jgi:hypothetical protein
LIQAGAGASVALCYPAGVIRSLLRFAPSDRPGPSGLVAALFAAASGLALANLWWRHRQALARDRAHWAALAARRGWHLVERGGSFAVIGAVEAAPGVSFHLSQGAIAHGDIGVFLETRLPRAPWLICELFAAASPVALTARRPGARVELPRPSEGKHDPALQLWSNHRARAPQLCDEPVRAALAQLPRPYLLYQNGIVVLIWPCVALPSDAQLDAAIACVAALAGASRALGG